MQSVQAQLQPAELGPLRDFDQTLVFEETDLDFLDELVGYPYDEELQLLDSCGTASPSWDNTTASSFGMEMTHNPQQLLLADQHKPHSLLPNAKERTKELNRRHQKRFRERRKVQKQQLQAELAQTKAALKRAQAQRHSPSDLGLSLIFSSKHENKSLLPIVYGTGQAPQGLDCSVHALLQTPYTAWGALLTSILRQDQEEACQQVARMTYSQLAVMRQGHVNKIAKLLLATGQDVAPHGFQLGQLVQEYCTLYLVTARTTPREWGRIVTGRALTGPADEEQAFSQHKPDWTALLRLLQLTQDQKRAFLSHRRTYTAHMMQLSKLRKQLLQQLHSEPALELSNSELEARQTCEDQILRQLENCTVEATLRYFEYMGSVGHSVMTLWQASVGIVHSFPHPPDVLAMGNALAEEEGDLSAESLHAAAVISGPPATTGSAWSQASALAIMDDWTQNCVASARSGVPESEVIANDVFG